MRILVVNSFFPPRTTGSAHFTLDVAREYVAAGHEVTVLTAGTERVVVDERVEGMRVVRLPAAWVTPGSLAFHYSLPFVVRPSALRRIRRLFDEVDPHVVHQNGQYFDLTFLTTWVAARRGIPRVLTVHTPMMHTNPWLRRFIAGVDRTLLRWLNAPGRPVVVGVDRFVCEMAERRYRPASGPVRFIPATLRVDRFGGGDGFAIRTRYGLGEAPVLLSFGHVIPIRSRVPLVQALPALLERHPELRVLVVGQVYTDEFLRVAHGLGVADRLVVAGRVEHHEVPDVLAAATVESHDLDGHNPGITTMEVMAAGVPVFARVRRDVFPSIDLDEWPDLQIVEHASPAEIAAAIDRLLSDPELRGRVVAQQRELVSRHFASGVVGGQYLALLGGLVDGVVPPGHVLARRRGRPGAR